MSIDKNQTPYWSMTPEQTLAHFNANLERGLTSGQIEPLRQKHGANVLVYKKPVQLWRILSNQLKSIIVALLLFAMTVSLIMGQFAEGFAVLAVLVINATIGFVTELKAIRSIEALKKMGQFSTKVTRDGEVLYIPAEELLPGDLVDFEGGDVITADVRLIEASRVNADESLLTGESVPVEKSLKSLLINTPTEEQTSLLFKGTSLTQGSAKGVVIAIGHNTQLGKIANLTEQAQGESTPLEKKLNHLGSRLVLLTLIIAAIILLLGLNSGKDLMMMFETAIALAVAAIPEGLPIVATIALAKGMHRMAKKNALISKLSAVETLGATTIICTDKTGTLTENKMTVSRFELSEGSVTVTPKSELPPDDSFVFKLNHKGITAEGMEALKKAIEVGLLCNNAIIDHRQTPLGDPTEIALLNVGVFADKTKSGLLIKYPKVREEAFDPEARMMATIHQLSTDSYLVAVKGALEKVIQRAKYLLTDKGVRPLTPSDIKEWLEKNNKLASSGLRVLALAYKESESLSTEPYEDLVLIGLVGLLDPPRYEVKNAISACRQSGIKVVMITGDQCETALNIAKSVSLIESTYGAAVAGHNISDIDSENLKNAGMLLEARVFYRVSPKQKLNLVKFYQQQINVVAMTGDGVNDAPALKKADIGVAMGLRGTQVAKEASDMVLTDDSFNTIVEAIEQGRVIFANIRRFVIYLLSCNISEVFVVAIASFVNSPLPLLPLQILFLNLVTDIFPALALGLGEKDHSYLNAPPRDPSAPVLSRSHWVAILTSGLVLTVSVLLCFYISLYQLNLGVEKSVTMCFLTLAFSQLFHVFNMKSITSKIFSNEITKSIYIWGALVLCTGLILLTVYVPFLKDLLKISTLNINQWGLVMGFSLLPLVVLQGAHLVTCKYFSKFKNILD